MAPELKAALAILLVALAALIAIAIGNPLGHLADPFTTHLTATNTR